MHQHPQETATQHFPHWTLPSGEPISYGWTFQEWLEAVRRLLARGMGCKETDPHLDQVLDNAPLGDYWSSGYSPEDTADDVEQSH